jgi:hypothetical protein
VECGLTNLLRPLFEGVEDLNERMKIACELVEYPRIKIDG